MIRLQRVRAGQNIVDNVDAGPVCALSTADRGIYIRQGYSSARNNRSGHVPDCSIDGARRLLRIERQSAKKRNTDGDY
jgi:hypothetical protein